MHQLEVRVGPCLECGRLQFEDFAARVAHERELRAAIRPPDELVDHAGAVFCDAFVSRLHQPEMMAGLLVPLDFVAQASLRAPRLDGRHHRVGQMGQTRLLVFVQGSRHHVDQAKIAEVVSL